MRDVVFAKHVGDSVSDDGFSVTASTIQNHHCLYLHLSSVNECTAKELLQYLANVLHWQNLLKKVVPLVALGRGVILNVYVTEWGNLLGMPVELHRLKVEHSVAERYKVSVKVKPSCVYEVLEVGADVLYRAVAPHGLVKLKARSLQYLAHRDRKVFRSERLVHSAIEDMTTTVRVVYAGFLHGVAHKGREESYLSASRAYLSHFLHTLIGYGGHEFIV